MINEETKRKLRLMNIGEFIDVTDVQEQDVQALALSFDDRFQMMVDSVYQQKYNDKVRGLIKRAHLRLPKADIHDVFYHEKRSLNRGVIEGLATGKYIEESQSIVLQGYTSTGKTFLGCALAKEACRQLHRSMYIRVPDLLTEYADRSLLPGGKEKVLRKYSGFKVLVLDEWLLNDLSKEEIEFLFELSERRYDISSTIFCTLYRTEDWIKRLGNGAYAESIVERYEHNSIRIETGSMNMRDIFSNNR
jgi:DNA replication protein DnaC